MRNLDSTARPSLTAEQGTPASVAGGSFRTQRMTWKGEHLGQGDQQQKGQDKEASAQVEAQGMGRRGCSVTACRLRVSRTGRGLRREVSSTESETLGFKCADWRCMGGGRGLGEKEEG